jgi:hypothetical protein
MSMRGWRNVRAWEYVNLGFLNLGAEGGGCINVAAGWGIISGAALGDDE